MQQGVRVFDALKIFFRHGANIAHDMGKIGVARI